MELSRELLLLATINKYGVDAVMGRAFSYNEILSMNTAESIVHAYNERAKEEDWVKWNQENPYKASLLNEATRLVHGTESD